MIVEVVMRWGCNRDVVVVAIDSRGIDRDMVTTLASGTTEGVAQSTY